MTTNYFFLKDGILRCIKEEDMPLFYETFSLYESAIESAKSKSIEVENHRETIVELQAEHGFGVIKEGDIHSLECNVTIKNDGICPCVRECGCNIKKLAFVSISAEKPKEESQEKNLVKQIRVKELLDKMIAADLKLYEQILDSDLAYYFNELTKLAMK